VKLSFLLSLLIFLFACRAFSAEVFRRTWFTLVTEIRTVLLIKSPGIDASTVDSRSALKWECPKNVSGISKKKKKVFCFVCLIYKYICSASKVKSWRTLVYEIQTFTDDILWRVGVNRDDMKWSNYGEFLIKLEWQVVKRQEVLVLWMGDLYSRAVTDSLCAVTQPQHRAMWCLHVPILTVGIRIFLSVRLKRDKKQEY
jgi:hypothetical protein